MKATPCALPFLDGATFVTDGGIETTLMFLEGIDLPHLAAYPLLRTVDGRRSLWDYFAGYADLGRRREVGILLDTPTWRASADWGRLLGDDQPALDEANAHAVALLLDVRAQHATPASPIVISGSIGPRFDGYVSGEEMTASAAAAYHGPQVRQLSRSGVDVISALTMTYPNEAIGIADAAHANGVLCAVAFTVEVDGRLPNGDALGDAIREVDEAASGSIAYFMVNCAHPSHFETIIGLDDAWVSRIRGVRVNASTASHAELGEMDTLDSGDPADLAARLQRLCDRHRHLTLLGGCCGTDERHIDAIAACVDG
ncbi:MAG: homocysteine S-methyltransferase family protein [Ilumatobacter sp.]|uniref:homocysteine S-methyltransferase family protein n=1 Tax=Ilumatobacter sp. TaxID=1967498 RepID=UPI003C789F29